MSDTILQRVYQSIFRRSQGRRLERAVTTFGIPVISIGGLTAGGAGKTPAVLLVAEQVIRAGYRPLVLSRGYRGAAEKGYLVLLGGTPLSEIDPAQSGDEPALLASMLREGAVVIGRDRGTNLHRFLAGEVGSRDERWVAVLDDGFQHRQIVRDLDILLLNDQTVDQGRLLPVGRLREPLSAAGRADLILYVDETQQRVDVDRIVSRLRSTVDQDATAILPVRSQTEWPRGQVDGEALPANAGTILVTGIANPERVERSLEGLGVNVIGVIPFRDHHRYGASDVAGILRELHASGADAVVTTSKDAVKLSRFESLRNLMYTVPHRLDSIDGDALFNAVVRAIQTAEKRISG